ncbi:hypothetical protein R3P38DRAFT_3206479 [Favolaschia claudopus]|uniref:Uncharacterized protein n=1 Tax=Favolaschia claudopus TaxID=2862362 RepID=A0AAW0AL53_9AGAR
MSASEKNSPLPSTFPAPNSTSLETLPPIKTLGLLPAGRDRDSSNKNEPPSTSAQASPTGHTMPMHRDVRGGGRYGIPAPLLLPAQIPERRGGPIVVPDPRRGTANSTILLQCNSCGSLRPVLPQIPAATAPYTEGTNTPRHLSDRVGGHGQYIPFKCSMLHCPRLALPACTRRLCGICCEEQQRPQRQRYHPYEANKRRRSE